MNPDVSAAWKQAGDNLTLVPLSDDLAAGAAELFRALADPKRVKILHLLAQHEMTTSALAGLLDLSLPAVSQHLRLLRLLRIVKPRREGHMVQYSLDDRHMEMLISPTISHLQEEQKLGNRRLPRSVRS